ncbi:hypothetical protein H0H93_014279, partial [Arthromyces matolae]
LPKTVRWHPSVAETDSSSNNGLSISSSPPRRRRRRPPPPPPPPPVLNVAHDAAWSPDLPSPPPTKELPMTPDGSTQPLPIRFPTRPRRRPPPPPPPPKSRRMGKVFGGKGYDQNKGIVNAVAMFKAGEESMRNAMEKGKENENEGANEGDVEDLVGGLI